jgi:hypothetical protein
MPKGSGRLVPGRALDASSFAKPTSIGGGKASPKGGPSRPLDGFPGAAELACPAGPGPPAPCFFTQADEAAQQRRYNRRLRKNAGVAQSVEQLIRNEKVGCSIHLSGTNPKGKAAGEMLAAFVFGAPQSAAL